MAEQFDFLSTSSAADSPVPISASQDAAPDSPANIPGCGSKCTGSCENCGPAGSLLKTLLLCELEALTGSCLTWRESATPLGRSWLALTTLDCPTEENAPGFSPCEWPTPTATPYGSSNNGCPGDGREEYATKGKPSLERLAMWPTATAQDSERSGSRTTADSNAHPGISLTDAVVHGLTIRDEARRVWTTPAETEPRLGYQQRPPGMASQQNQQSLTTQVVDESPHAPASVNTTGRPRALFRLLNADWVYQLMGYPREWARLSTARASQQRETQSSPKSPSSSDA